MPTNGKRRMAHAQITACGEGRWRFFSYLERVAVYLLSLLFIDELF